jgi:polysaccharide deacetylase family protein (PEP-CTERM system associated)
VAPAADRFGGFVLSFDLEDWHQLVRRSAGAGDWDAPHPAFSRQVGVILDLLDELDVKATFFVLGISAKNHPQLVADVAARGHEIASHGYAHARVHAQTPDEFRHDLEESIRVLDDVCGRRPAGFRAPAFSINRDTPWAYEILAELGFRYDSSQYDSPRIPRRFRGIPDDAFRLQLASGTELWEFPVAVWRIGRRALPVGGGGYWRAFPNRLLLHALRRVKESSTYPVLYSHPYEFDPSPLRVAMPRSASARQRLKAASRSLYRNSGRGRMTRQLASVAREFPLVPYESLFLDNALRGEGAKSLSPEGALV